jgi:antitoxin ParD1/3/4
MSNLNLALSTTEEEWIASQSEAGHFASPNEYVRDLIRRDHERSEKRARLWQLVNEGLESGISTSTMHDIKRKALARLEASSSHAK